MIQANLSYTEFHYANLLTAIIKIRYSNVTISKLTTTKSAQPFLSAHSDVIDSIISVHRVDWRDQETGKVIIPQRQLKIALA